MLGWKTQDYGNHAVLVTGYRESGENEPTVYQWTPKCGYKPLEEIFGSEGSPSPFGK